jgi:hypothetical protein
MLVLIVAGAKILRVKAGISVDLPCLPCQPACLVSLPALSTCQPCQPVCLVSLSALSACLPCQLVSLVSLPALSACLPCQPACLVSLPALSACLPCQPACLVSPTISVLVFAEVDCFCKLICLVQSTSLRYLWTRLILKVFPNYLQNSDPFDSPPSI